MHLLFGDFKLVYSKYYMQNKFFLAEKNCYHSMSTVYFAGNTGCSISFTECKHFYKNTITDHKKKGLFTFFSKRTFGVKYFL